MTNLVTNPHKTKKTEYTTTHLAYQKSNNEYAFQQYIIYLSDMQYTLGRLSFIQKNL